MSKLSPKQTAAIARRTGLSFKSVRRSRRVPQMLKLEEAYDAIKADIAALVVRMRAYKLAIKCAETVAERIELRVLREQAQHKLDLMRLTRDRIRRDVVAVKLTIEGRAFPDAVKPAVVINDIAPDPDDVNEKLRKLFNV